MVLACIATTCCHCNVSSPQVGNPQRCGATRPAALAELPKIVGTHCPNGARAVREGPTQSFATAAVRWVGEYSGAGSSVTHCWLMHCAVPLRCILAGISADGPRNDTVYISRTQVLARSALRLAWAARTAVCWSPSIAPLSRTVQAACTPGSCTVHRQVRARVLAGRALRRGWARHAAAKLRSALLPCSATGASAERPPPCAVRCDRCDHSCRLPTPRDLVFHLRRGAGLGRR
jgi:hypothetical protein